MGEGHGQYHRGNKCRKRRRRERRPKGPITLTVVKIEGSWVIDSRWGTTKILRLYYIVDYGFRVRLPLPGPDIRSSKRSGKVIDWTPKET